MPGAEVLRGELTAGDLAEVVVDVMALDVGPRAVDLVGQQLGTATAPPLQRAAVVASVRPPTRGISARRLNMSVGRRTDPHVRPRRRDREVTDPLQRRGVGDATATGVDVRETAPALHPPDSGLGTVDPPESGHRG